MSLKEPTHFVLDDRLTEADGKLLGDLNASLERVGRPVGNQRLGRIFALESRMELGDTSARPSAQAGSSHGVAVALNTRCTLSAVLSARPLVETFVILAEVTLSGRVAEPRGQPDNQPGG